jgi:hemolysin activation/secretion protein
MLRTTRVIADFMLLRLRSKYNTTKKCLFGALALVFSGALSLPAMAQAPAPAPSLVEPPTIVAPTPSTRITLPSVPAGAATPEQAKKLFFKLTGIDVQGEFPELEAARKELEAAVIGKRISVADLFEFANKLQQAYVNAGYPLARVVTLPQELDKEARVKLRVIDGFIERMDLEALPQQVRNRVYIVLSPLIGKTHLMQKELERQLLIAGETPGLILNATFGAGKEIGGSLLVLTGRYRPVSASLYVDNALPTSFATWQAVSSASFNSLLGLGEQISISAAGYPNEDYFTPYPTRRYLGATFVVPLGIDGWKLELGGLDGRTTPHVDPTVATQGQLDQGHAKLSYEVVKLRDTELNFSGRFDATDERISSLLFTPAVPLSQDRLRVVRWGIDGIIRLREVGTTFDYALNVSRGLNDFGARAADEANALLPLSRLGADDVFSKVDGHLNINQNLPEQLFVAVLLAGQSSGGRPLLTSEQFDITGASALSGYTSGALPGDTAWVSRAEFGRSFLIPIETGGVTIAPYAFAATGERILEEPTVLEVGDVHASDFGVGTRFTLTPWNNTMPDSYSFVEWSHRSTSYVPLQGERVFAGMVLRY